jgi:hypothetical protein
MVHEAAARPNPDKVSPRERFCAGDQSFSVGAETVANYYNSGNQRPLSRRLAEQQTIVSCALHRISKSAYGTILVTTYNGLKAPARGPLSGTDTHYPPIGSDRSPCALATTRLKNAGPPSQMRHVTKTARGCGVRNLGFWACSSRFSGHGLRVASFVTAGIENIAPGEMTSIPPAGASPESDS